MTLPDGYPRSVQRAADPLEPTYREPITVAATATAAGVATATLPPVPFGFRWLIDYLVITSDSAVTSACSVYDSTISNAQLLDGTANLGNSGVAAYLPARALGSSRQLIVQWTGAPGAKCTVRLEYRQQPEG